MMWPADKGEILLLPEGRSGELQFDGPRVIGFSSRPLHDGGEQQVGMVVSFADITERKAQQKAEAHRQRLADLGEVVSTIAHEIRNPVFAITSLAQVLSTEEVLEHDPELKDMALKILEEGRRVARLVDDLLAFGRERPLERKPIDVVSLVETIIQDLNRGKFGSCAPGETRAPAGDCG